MFSLWWCWLCGECNLFFLPLCVCCCVGWVAVAALWSEELGCCEEVVLGVGWLPEEGGIYF